MATSWFHIPTAQDGDNTYPSGDMSSRDASFTATAAESAVIDAAWTTIKGIQLGPSQTAGSLEIRQHDSTTLIRAIDLPAISSTNMTSNYNIVPFSFPGPWTANVTTGGGVDVYIQYESANVWRPTV